MEYNKYDITTSVGPYMTMGVLLNPFLEMPSQAANVSKRSSDVLALQEVSVELLLGEGAVGRCGHTNLTQRERESRRVVNNKWSKHGAKRPSSRIFIDVLSSIYPLTVHMCSILSVTQSFKS